MSLQKRNIGRIPVYFGDWDSTKKYAAKNRVTLYGSEFESKIENNLNHAPATYNESTHVVSFDTDRWYIISNGTDAYFAAQRIDSMEGAIEVHDSSINSLQDQINNMIAGGTTIEFTVTPSAVFVNTATSVTLKSKITTTGVVTGHQILKGGVVKASDTSTNVTYVDQNLTLTANQSYDSSASISGVKVPTKTVTVSAVYPIYYGSGTTYDNFASNKVKFGTATPTPKRTYTVTVRGNGQHVFFAVPNTMTINHVWMGKFEMTMKTMYTKTINESPYGSYTYKVYESYETYDAQTMDLTIE